MVNRKKSKTKFHKKFIWIPALVIGVILLALFHPILFALDEINPIYNADDYVVPELSIQEMQNNQQINEQINEIAQDPTLFCEADEITLQMIAQCQLITSGEITVTNPPVGVDPDTFVNCSGINQETPLACDDEIALLIQQLQGGITITEPINNQTENSDDPPGQQLCDLEPENVLCGTLLPEASAITLQAKVTKVTSQGQRIEAISEFDLPRQAFLIEEETTLDFRNGFLEIELVALTDPQVVLTGTGQLDILVGGVSIFTTPLTISVPVTNNTQGIVPLEIQGAPKISFSFGVHFTKFANFATTPVQIKIVSIDMSDGTNQFVNQDLTIFTINISRDDIQILLQDELGNNVRAFPSDSRVVIHSVSSKSEPVLVGLIRQIVWDSTFYGNGLGCSQPFKVSDTTYTPSTSTTITVPAPTITGISLVDSEGIAISTSSGGSGNSLYDFDQITRNATYTLTASGISGILDYGENQETKSFTCSQEGIPNLVTTSSRSGNCSVACGSCVDRLYTSISTTNPLTLGAISCNFP